MARLLAAVMLLLLCAAAGGCVWEGVTPNRASQTVDIDTTGSGPLVSPSSGQRYCN